METIVIVMPTYNEDSCIGEMIETLMGGTFPGMQADMHLLIVDDSSPDGTAQIVIEKMSRYPHLHLLYRTVRLARRVTELPIQFRSRASGETKFSLREIMATCSVLLSLRVKQTDRWPSHEEK